MNSFYIPFNFGLVELYHAALRLQAKPDFAFSIFSVEKNMLQFDMGIKLQVLSEKFES